MKRSLAALVIGNGDYEDATPLDNANNDADDMSVKLLSYGFDVTKLVNATHEEMDEGLFEFKTALMKNDVGLFFFAGHGMQIMGENYLIAVNTRVDSEVAVKHSSLALNKVLDYTNRL